MATGGQQEATCRIVKDRILELEAGRAFFNGIVIIDDKLVVTDYWSRNLKIYNRQDGQLISKSGKMESEPTGVCILNDTQVAVCLLTGEIIILSLESMYDVKLIKTIRLRREGFFFESYSVIKWNSDKIIVSGKNHSDSILYWCIVSTEHEGLDSIRDICKVKDVACTRLAIQHNTLYISCYSFDSAVDGVYAFDVLNPKHKPKVLYQHKDLEYPWAIMTDMDYVYVCNRHSNRMHQLTLNCQLIRIHKVSSQIYRLSYDDQNGLLYTTSEDSNQITIYKLEYSHQAGIPFEILKMDDKSIQRFEEALKDGKETVYSILIMVVGALATGKSTLVKRLLGKSVNMLNRSSTEGIDVYVNCCDVSLSTQKWTMQSDSEQDYNLQRLVKVLNENYHTRGRIWDSNPGERSSQREGTEEHYSKPVADDDNKEIQNPNPTSNFSVQGESSSTLVHMAPQLELLEKPATENDRRNQLREMLNLLQRNPEKARQHETKYARLTIYDFAGQYAFYTTHQIFLTHRAIYLLVSDSSKAVSDLVADDTYFDSQGKLKCSALDLAEIWMTSIHSCASPGTHGMHSVNTQVASHKITLPPVILVGTHIDQIPQIQKGIFGRVLHTIHQFVSPLLALRNQVGYVANVVHDIHQFVTSKMDQREYCRSHGQRCLKKIFESLKDSPTKVHLVDEVFAIDNTVVDNELVKLKEKIVEVASQSPYWGEQIPTRWFLLEQQLMRLRKAGMKVIPRITVEDLSKEGTVKIKESEELDLFLKYLHENGTIIYFSIEALRDNVVLDPVWLIDALKSLINAQPNLPTNPADNGTESNRPNSNAAHNDLTHKWINFKSKGILTLDIVDAIWTKENHPELYANKLHILMLMEQFNIIAKPRSFNEMGEKVENYFLAPCMLRQECPVNVIFPELDPSKVTTPEMCCIFTGKYLPTPIFHRLLAACVARWPVAKKESENLIFCGCCVFDVDLFHRLTVYIKDHIVYAKITRLMMEEIKDPDGKLCSQVRKFITQNLNKITSYLGQNLKYTLHAEFQTWFADEGHDPDAPITREHMNHSRLCVALVTICRNAMRDVLHKNVPPPHTDINNAILAHKRLLTGKKGRALFDMNQIKMIFPDPQGKTVGNVDHIDISLLYILIRNITTCSAPNTGWGIEPDEQPRDKSLGASIERIRLYRNIVAHSVDAKVSMQEFDNLWKKLECVIDDIGQVIGKHEYKTQLDCLKNQVISVFEAY